VVVVVVVTLDFGLWTLNERWICTTECTVRLILYSVVSTCFLLFASDFIPGLRSTTNSLEDIDVRNNPFVALVERMGADYRPILVGAVPSLVVVNGRRVEEAERGEGRALLAGEQRIQSYDTLLASCIRPTLATPRSKENNRMNRVNNVNHMNHMNSMNSSGKRPNNDNMPPPSPAAGSAQAKQWALKMLQSQQMDVVQGGGGGGGGGSSSFSSPNSILHHNPRQFQQMQQLQQRQQRQRMQSTTTAHHPSSPLRRRPRTIDFGASQSSSQPSQPSQPSQKPPQPLGTLVNVTKEVTRLRQEVSVMRKYVRHWIQKER
jgi:hypothetical protein